MAIPSRSVFGGDRWMISDSPRPALVIGASGSALKETFAPSPAECAVSPLRSSVSDPAGVKSVHPTQEGMRQLLNISGVPGRADEPGSIDAAIREPVPGWSSLPPSY